MKKVFLIYNKANTAQGIQALEKVLKGFSVKQADPLEPPQACDLAVHVEVPFYGWMSWSARNVFLVNPERWEAGWNSYLARCDALIFKSSADKDSFYGLYPEVSSVVASYTVPWMDEATATAAGAETFAKIVSSAPASPQGQPKLASAESCPPISIVTLLHNRRRFVDLCLHNLLITDYPKDKIEWVVVEDSDIVEEQAADKVLKFGRGCAPMSVSYIPLEKKNVPIGSMRNKAIKMAQHDIILFMDDDDHYPPTSFSKRVAWLVAHPWQPKAVACTTIACYDLIRGTSAVNTPPWTLPLRQRISEATLTFYKSWWEAKKFPKVSMAEGEGFLEGRESDVLELPPQQMIVAMSHGKNTSGRRIPPSGQEPSCFWGFPKEFLVFLHKLAGVDVADAEATAEAEATA